MKKFEAFLAGFLFVLMFAGSSNALTIDTYGEWNSYTGVHEMADDYVIFNNNLSYGSTSTISWGSDPWDSVAETFPFATPQSALSFTGETGVAANIGDIFTLGSLTHYNYAIYTYTSITSADLSIYLYISELNLLQTFTFTFDIQETDNSLQNTDDYISFQSYFASETFTIAGTEYTLELLGFMDDNGDYIQNFTSAEQNFADAMLYGRITASGTTVPEPTTIALLGMGLIGIASVGRRRKNN